MPINTRGGQDPGAAVRIGNISIPPTPPVHAVERVVGLKRTAPPSRLIESCAIREYCHAWFSVER